MSKTVLAESDGFTPVIDGVVRELGLMSAVVFGRVWRYCQMEDQVCKASLEKIGGSIGVDRVTVMRHVKELCEHGYLKDLTPELKNRPHVYVDTGKAGIKVSIYGVAESNTYSSGVSESDTTVSESEATVAERNRGVSESHLNKVLKKELKDTKEEIDIESEKQKELIISALSIPAANIWPKEPRKWWDLEARIRAAQTIIQDGVLIISGFGMQAAWYDERVRPYFNNALVVNKIGGFTSLTFQE